MLDRMEHWVSSDRALLRFLRLKRFQKCCLHEEKLTFVRLSVIEGVYALSFITPIFFV